jgi:hypothetical protein
VSGSFHGSVGSGSSGVAMTGGSPGRVGASGGSGSTSGRGSVPAPTGESSEREKADEGDDDAQDETPEDRNHDPDDDQQTAEGDSSHSHFLPRRGSVETTWSRLARARLLRFTSARSRGVRIQKSRMIAEGSFPQVREKRLGLTTPVFDFLR